VVSFGASVCRRATFLVSGGVLVLLLILVVVNKIDRNQPISSKSAHPSSPPLHSLTHIYTHTQQRAAARTPSLERALIVSVAQGEEGGEGGDVSPPPPTAAVTAGAAGAESGDDDDESSTDR
jgi:hypothetical protein